MVFTLTNIVKNFLSVQILTGLEIFTSSLFLENGCRDLFLTDYPLTAVTGLFSITLGTINVLGNTLIPIVLKDVETKNIIIGIMMGTASAYIKEITNVPQALYKIKHPRIIYPLSVLAYVTVYSQTISKIADPLM